MREKKYNRAKQSEWQQDPPFANMYTHALMLKEDHRSPEKILEVKKNLAMCSAKTNTEGRKFMTRS